VLPFKNKQDPSNGWAVPYVTGKRYNIWWAAQLLDWTAMTYSLSDRWTSTDLAINFVHQYADVREGGFPMSYVDEAGTTQDIEMNLMKTAEAADLKTGDNTQAMPYDEEAPGAQELEFVVNGKDMLNRKTITMQAWRCAGNSCLEDVVESDIETTERFWSRNDAWTNTENELPKADEDVEVAPGWNMIFDLSGVSPIYQFVTINGRLTFRPEGEAALHLRCKQLFIR